MLALPVQDWMGLTCSLVVLQLTLFCQRLDVINKCFSRQSVEEILSCLGQEVISRNEKWITTAVKSIKTASPISLKLFLLSIRKGRSEDLEQCLIQEYRMSSHVLRRTVSNDFYEGVRAKLLDKDNNPKWEPSRLELVSNEMLEKCLTKLDEDEAWEDLQLPSEHRHTNPRIAKL
ncbi:Enoyl-CoA hydratase/isomerase family [Musa troglodytarum]|uniref:3-hydroxyisobutyryl-CoA hydrolase n=1 Tax=Musa troglodytarum TaxID=320322 RepID=A0A9E7FNA4_9LILI|nr:Enoyl-CoA hydratase/isomerase family [Musa troglodytarum]